MPKLFKNRKELGLERMFETRSEAWEAVGLAFESSQKVVRRAQKEAAILIPLVIGVLILYGDRHRLLGEH
jgi:hypothetical protein